MTLSPTEATPPAHRRKRVITLRLGLHGLWLAWILPFGLGLSAIATTAAAESPQAVKLREAAFDLAAKREHRIFRIGERLRASGLDLCPDEQRLIWGITTITERERVNLSFVSWKSRRKTKRDVEVLTVDDGSPASRAGLQVGDVVVELDGKPLRTSSDLYRRLDRPKRSEIPVLVRRGAQELEVQMPLELGCFTGAGLWLSDQVNAYKTHHGIYITSGMIRFATSDDEIAILLGHELGHGILQTGSKPHFEADADYIGLYLAARAGFEISAAPEFWKRIALRNPYVLTDSRNSGFRSHPRSAGRALALESTIQEIQAKLHDDLPLDPAVPE